MLIGVNTALDQFFSLTIFRELHIHKTRTEDMILKYNSALNHKLVKIYYYVSSTYLMHFLNLAKYTFQIDYASDSTQKQAIFFDHV